ncbi:MAG TPA: nitrogenase component 1, partial [Clostridia bacterium]|nr:nitrogenase component 1 [Clostridia bacterium]
EALPCAEILSRKCKTPWLSGSPYGYAGTLAFLQAISSRIGRPVRAELAAELKKRAAEAGQTKMYLRMLRKHRPAATLVGEYAAVQGLAGLLAELGLPVDQKISLHSLAAFEDPDRQVAYLPHEKERMRRMQSLHRQLVLADDVSLSLCAADNVGLRISAPLVFGAQVANHLPLMGMRGADFIMETVERYLQA